MAEALANAIAFVGIDIGKNSFHVVGLDRSGEIVLRQKWSRGHLAFVVNWGTVELTANQRKHRRPDPGIKGQDRGIAGKRFRHGEILPSEFHIIKLTT